MTPSLHAWWRAGLRDGVNVLAREGMHLRRYLVEAARRVQTRGSRRLRARDRAAYAMGAAAAVLLVGETSNDRELN